MTWLTTPVSRRVVVYVSLVLLVIFGSAILWQRTNVNSAVSREQAERQDSICRTTNGIAKREDHKWLLIANAIVGKHDQSREALLKDLRDDPASTTPRGRKTIAFVALVLLPFPKARC